MSSGRAEEVGLALAAELEVEQRHVGGERRGGERREDGVGERGGTSPLRIPCHLTSRSSGQPAAESVSCQTRRSSGQSVSRTAIPPSAKSPPWSIWPLSSRKSRCTGHFVASRAPKRHSFVTVAQIGLARRYHQCMSLYGRRSMHLKAPRTRILGAVLAFGLVMAVGVSLAAIHAPANEGLIHACKSKETGKLRVVSNAGQCRRGEQYLSWNIRGPQGPAGLQGVAGPAGADGAAGPAGPQGPQGPAGPEGPAGPKGEKGDNGEKGDSGSALASFDALEGLGCTLGTEAGSIQIDYDGSTGVATITCHVESGPPADPAIVRINEFSVGVEGALGDEFVELVNVGGTAADLSGWRLVYRSGAGTSDVSLGTLPDGTTLAPGAFLLFGGSAYAGAHPADRTFSAGLASAAGGVGLRDADGALVDSLGWGTASNAFVETAAAAAPPIAAAPGTSGARSPDGHDTNDNSADFAVDDSPSPGAAN